jgi:hypothetical protein
MGNGRFSVVLPSSKSDTHPVTPITQPATQSIARSVAQSLIQQLNQLLGHIMKQDNLLILTQLLGQGLNHPFTLLMLSVNHSTTQSTSKSAIQSVYQTITLPDSNQVLGHAVRQQDNHSISNPVNKPGTQPFSS